MTTLRHGRDCHAARDHARPEKVILAARAARADGDRAEWSGVVTSYHSQDNVIIIVPAPHYVV